MVKRPKVPAALHSELSEYAALIRALRTSNTLDLTSQLARASASQAASRPGSADNSDHQDDDTESGRPVTESVYQDDRVELKHKSSKRKRRISVGVSISSQDRGKGRARDTWTRWPLLAGDVHVPEWNLEDEVKLLATRCLQLESPRSLFSSSDLPTNASGQELPPENIDGEDDENPIIQPSTMGALTDSSATYLSRILALLAAHIPPAEKSMQNRVKPINWETVLDVVGASGLVNANILQNVSRRMEVVYGASNSNVISRVQTASSIELRLAGACSAHDFSFLTFPGYDSKASLPKCKRGPYKKMKVQGTALDSDTVSSWPLHVPARAIGFSRPAR